MITSEGREKGVFIFYLNILHGLVPTLTVASCKTAEYLLQAPAAAAPAYGDSPWQAVGASP